VPWTLLSAGVGFEEFVKRVGIALDNGASGFIAGRAIWGEAAALTGAARLAFLEETAVPRLAALCDVLGEHGRPWREVAA
jgi:tagatose-1,6-bisphosphate aldolase